MATRNLLFIADDDEVVVRLLSGLTGSHEDVLRRQFEDGGTSSMQVAGGNQSTPAPVHVRSHDREDAFSITIFRSSLPPPTPSLSKIYYVTSGLGRHKPQDINVALISNIQKRVDFAVVLADIADARNAARAQPFADRLAQLYKPDCIIYAGDDNYNDLICHMRSPPARIILTKDLPEISRSERSRLEEQIRTISSERDLLKEKNRVLEGQIFEYRRLLRLEQAVQTDNSEPLCPEIADLVRNVVGLRNVSAFQRVVARLLNLGFH